MLVSLLVPAAALAGVEAYLRLSDYRPEYEIESPGAVEKLRIVLDPKLLYDLPGWKLPPRPEGTRLRVALYGDSFVMGINVQPQDRLSAQLQKRLGPKVQVINLGLHGAGPDQAYLRFLRDLPRLDADLVLLGLFPSNDFFDLQKNQLLRLDDDGHLVGTEQNPIQAELAGFRLPLLVRKALTGHYLPAEREHEIERLLFEDRATLIVDPTDPRARAAAALMGGIFRAWDATCRKAEVPWAAFVIPGLVCAPIYTKAGIPPELHRNNERIVLEQLQGASIPHLDLTGALLAAGGVSACFRPFPPDGHFNERGNAVSAEALAEFIRARFPQLMAP